MLPLLVGVEQFAMDAIPQWKQFQARDFWDDFQGEWFWAIHFLPSVSSFTVFDSRREIEPQTYKSHQLLGISVDKAL